MALLGGAVAVEALDSDFTDEVVFSGLDTPTNVEFAANGQVFVAEKGGKIKVFDSLTDTTPDVFADLSSNVHDFWDRGMLGLAIHPDFPTSPYVYVLYTYDAPIGGSPPTWGDGCSSPPGATNDGCVVSGRLSRLTANGNQWTGVEEVFVEDWCSQYPSHAIGDLEFGADGALYASGGDGASFNWVDYGQGGGDSGSPTPENPCGDPPVPVGGNQTAPSAEGGALRSQDLETSGDPVGLDGTVIRLDPDTGLAMADNPLIGHPDVNARRIVAYGLRNPFRLAIKPGTSEFYTGDVGWNTWEEVNHHPNPSSTVLNYGWPCYEGGNGVSNQQSGYAGLTICQDLYDAGGVTASFFAYGHSQDITGGDTCPPASPPQGTSSSVSGLAFYSGGAYPGTYNGALFGSDYSRDCIWVMFANASGDPDPSTVTVFHDNAVDPVDLEAGPGGDIFYVDITGTIRRLRFIGANTPPTAVLNANPTSGQAPLTVNFDASESTDADEDALSFAWDFDDDGEYDDAIGPNPQWTFNAPGSHLARVQVTDARGETDTASVVIQASNGPPVPVIDTPSASLQWQVGDFVAFSGHATDPDEGLLAASALDWDLDLHHCEDDGSCHVHGLSSFNGVSSGSFNTPDHEYPSWLELTLTATDEYGASASTSILLQPQTVDLTFESSPPGFDLSFSGVDETTPFVEEVIVNSLFSIGASSPQQTPDLFWWVFASWSDGGSQLHEITAPASPTTYTATFNRYPELLASTEVDSAENQTGVTDVDATDDSDSEGSGLIYSLTGGADQGDFSIVGSTGVLTLVAPPDFENPTDADIDGVYEVTVTVTDSGGLTDVVAISVTVTDVDESPTATDDNYSTDEDVQLVVNTVGGVLDNDTDPEGDPLIASVVANPTHGILSLAPDGSFTYTPDTNWSGIDQFSYEACDAEPLCDNAIVTITVDPVNDAPVASDDEYEMFQDAVLNRGSTTGLLANDSDLDGTGVTASLVTHPTNGELQLSPDGSFTYTPDSGWFGVDQFAYEACDLEPLCDSATVTVEVNEDQVLSSGDGESFGLVDPTTGIWYLLDSDSLETTTFYYGVPGDFPIIGDWDCDGDETPGLFRVSDGYVYLRNSNTQGVADIKYFFGIAGDIPIAGDFDGDGCDTVSIYRPSEGRVYIINHLGSGDGGLGEADFAYHFGVPYDKPFVGDFDNDGIDEIGLHRESTGLVYFRLTHTQGVADVSFVYGIPDDRIVAADWAWKGLPGPDTVGVFRPGDAIFYLRYDNSPGVADITYPYGNSAMYPVAGDFGGLAGGGTPPPG